VHTHAFVENYDGLVGFGLDRETDEATVAVYLQKFSDDRLLREITPRMTDDELDRIFTMLSQLLRRHLSEDEYHSLFLRQADEQEEK
jgi:TorA maturation chaperone TorD